MNIASGSSGNATYIGSGSTHILIDAGLSRKRIQEGLSGAGISLKDITAILITHEHIDHIAALGVIERGREIPIYATAGTWEGIKNTRSLGQFNEEVFNEISCDQDFTIGDLTVRALSTWHDAKEPCCFRISDGKKSLAVVTDLGGCDEYLTGNLMGLSGILIEANHDVRMLEVGPYPYPLKKRIAGRTGHLSNEACGRLLSALLHDGMESITLGHLSHENNMPELALVTVENEIENSPSPYGKGDFEIKVAHRDLCSELEEI